MRLDFWRTKKRKYQDILPSIPTHYGGLMGQFPQQLSVPYMAYRLVGIIFRCVKVIAGAAVVDVEAVDEQGRPVEVPGFADWQRSPHPGMDWARWLSTIVGHIVISGGSRIILHPEDPKVMLPVPLDRCPPEQTETFPPKKYRYGQETIPAERIIEIISPDPTNYFDGTSPLEASFVEANALYLADLHISNSLLNGAVIPAILFLEREFTPEQFQEFLLKFKNAFQQARQSGSIPVLDANFKGRLEPAGYSIADMRLVELIEIAERRIASTMGVPPALLGDHESRYANFKEQRLTFLEDTLRPIWMMIASAFSLRLPQIFGRPFRVRFKTEMSFVLRQQFVEQIERLSAVRGRVMTVNEIRQVLNLPRLEDGDFLEIPIANLQLPAVEEKTTDRTSGDFELRLRESLRDLLSVSRHRQKLPANTRRMLWQWFDDLLGDYRAQENSGRGFMQRYGREMGKFFQALRRALIDSARVHWEREHAIPYDREMIAKEALKKRMTLLPAIYREGWRFGEVMLEHILGRGKRADDVWEIPEEVMRLIRQRAEHWTELTDDITFEAIEGIIRQGLAENFSLDKIIELLENEPMLSSARAERIARTEVLGALNEGAHLAYREEKAPAKEWLATQDDRVRDAHAEADGQIVALDMPFLVGGERLYFPGDPSGSPENIINCRCTILPAEL